MDERCSAVPVTVFTTAVRESSIGVTQQKRNFLPENTTSVVIDETNSVRHSGNAIFLDALPKDMATELSPRKWCWNAILDDRPPCTCPYI